MELVKDVTSNISRRSMKPKRAGAKVLGVREDLCAALTNVSINKELKGGTFLC